MQKPSIKLLIKALKFKNYSIFDSEDEPLLNIIGIRNHKRKPNSFDDLIIVLWKQHGRWTCRSFHVTTDPCLFFRDHPSYPSSKRILQEGQYLNSFKIGIYKGLVDFNTFMKDLKWGLIYRFIPVNLKDNYSKIDFKCINVPHRIINVNKLPGSCQLFDNPEEFKEFMGLISDKKKNIGNLYSYTLLSSYDLLGFRNHF